MENKFTKPKIHEMDKTAFTFECVEEQLKSMRLGYIAHSFVLRDMSDNFDVFYKLNFDKYEDDVIEKAAVHAEKQMEDPNHYNSPEMKDTPKEILNCIQSLLMIQNKVVELEGKSAELDIVRKNIAWLDELRIEMIETKAISETSTLDKNAL